MSTIRFVASMAIGVTAALVAGCASTGTGQADQYAARDCKAAPATFINRPQKNPTPAEQAEAKLKLGRLAAERGGYASGSNLLPDLNRDCY